MLWLDIYGLAKDDVLPVASFPQVVCLHKLKKNQILFNKIRPQFLFTGLNIPFKTYTPKKL